MQTLQVIFGLWAALFGVVRLGITLWISHGTLDRTVEACIGERTFENSCQNAKQRDRPTERHLSTRKQARAEFTQAQRTTVKAESRLKGGNFPDQYESRWTFEGVLTAMVAINHQ